MGRELCGYLSGTRLQRCTFLPSVTKEIKEMKEKSKK
jgi:hypothetical protein